MIVNGATVENGRLSLRTPALWFSALAGHAAWTAQLLLTYFALSVFCSLQPPRFGALGLDGASVVLIALTVVPAAIAVVAMVLGIAAWRQSGYDEPADTRGTGGWRGFLGAFGALLSGLFVLVILLTGTSFFYLSPCR